MKKPVFKVLKLNENNVTLETLPNITCNINDVVFMTSKKEYASFKNLNIKPLDERS